MHTQFHRESNYVRQWKPGFFFVQYSPYTSSIDCKSNVKTQVDRLKEYRSLLEVLFEDDKLEGPYYDQGKARWPIRLERIYDHPGSLKGERYIFYGYMVPPEVEGSPQASIQRLVQDLFYEKPQSVLKKSASDLKAKLEAKGIESQIAGELAKTDLESLYIEGPFLWFAWYLESEDGEPKLYFLDLGSGGGDH